ncbi:hypothetical protein G8764_11245 [Pseudomaricurvus alcaniphilus]|uniref:Clp1/GlmU family protein n=1 Tax=Pseudomaricurvus alcaniphilus TaxID=1166482 RepID=UPI00140AF412|nr:hypothetical protein [Pseudomaricurvus alcaniphilus]
MNRFYCLPDLSDLSDLEPLLTFGGKRLLLVGASGVGKSTLAAALLDQLAQLGGTGWCLSCDPGLPAFGPPGCLNLGYREGGQWIAFAQAPLCSLDAGRFRLPLVTAATELLARVGNRTLVIDTPGLVQGPGASELLLALAQAAAVDACLLLSPAGAPLPLTAALRSLSATVIQLPCAPQARPLARTDRLHQRSQRWQDYLGTNNTLQLSATELNLLGTPPALADVDAWRGRQVALYGEGRLQTLGEVTRVAANELHLRVASLPASVQQLLVRDAVHRNGVLRTVPKPVAPPPLPANSGASEVRVELGALTSVAREPQVAVRAGNVTATLVNGVMGDPLLQLRLLHQGRSLLFDIGDAGRMPLRAAHQVTDLFISHAHADHIGGFMWLVRCRIGDFPPCRLYGPAGIAHHIHGMVNGILWDRVEDRAPRFEIHEWHGDHLKRWQLVAGGDTLVPLDELPIDDNIIRREPGFVMRATELDHGIPVLAYAFESRNRLNVRKERLQALGLQPGPWLQDLKHAYLRSQWQQRIQLGKGRSASVSDLAAQLLLEQAGDKIAYATDFRDSPDNIAKLSQLAEGAHTLFCEASFMLADRAQAERTQHLTTDACARIAELAQVKQLVAFHFSHRYERQREAVYRELQGLSSRVVVPTTLERELV